MHSGPDKEHDDAEVRQLEGQPDVGPASEHLKPSAQPLGHVQQGGIDVKHSSATNHRSKNLELRVGGSNVASSSEHAEGSCGSASSSRCQREQDICVQGCDNDLP